MGADWEETAGRKQQFEAASVREDKLGSRSSSSFSLDNADACFNVSKDDALASKIGHKKLVNRATKKGPVRHSHVSFSNARKERCFAFSAISQG
jgi:hypothetical protein